MPEDEYQRLRQRLKESREDIPAPLASDVWEDDAYIEKYIGGAILLETREQRYRAYLRLTRIASRGLHELFAPDRKG